MAEQTKFEEHLNAISHGVGAILGLIGLGLLITYDTSKTTWSLFSVVVYDSLQEQLSFHNILSCQR